MDAVTNFEVSGDSRVKKSRRKNACFPYGNYHRYYGYRLADAFDEDPRLRAFDAAWFAGRKVLDIGCNEGVLTLSLACKFGCKETLGVDIDGALIGKAARALRSLRGQLTTQLRTPAAGLGHATSTREARVSVKALKRTRFERCDFVNEPPPAGRVLTVLCLSVTKWVHFNWGDDGVKRLFARAKAALHPGGLFVLEPQPWRSYRQVFKKPETLAALPHTDLAAFHLRPQHFADYLTGVLGFELVAERHVGEAAKGFDRPLLVFCKPEFKAAQGTGAGVA